MIVVDASIAAKWYLHEPGSDEAARLLTSNAILIAPALIRIEVNAAIIRRYREGRLSKELASDAAELWEADLAVGSIRLVPNDGLIPMAKTIAFQLRHALQDCLYLAAAIETKAERLVTADATFHERAKKTYSQLELQHYARPA